MRIISTITAILLLYFESAAQFGGQQIITTCICYPKTLEVVDIDSDGDKDLLYLDQFDEHIFWYENNGKEISLAPKFIPTQERGLGAIAIADFDGDKNLDIVCTSNEGKIIWLNNRGNGKFTRIQSLQYQPYFNNNIQVADIDGDGDNDVLTSTTANGSVHWYRNNGQAKFSDAIEIGIFDSPTGLVAGDVDDDKDIDFLVRANSNSEIMLMLNSGKGVFTRAPSLLIRYSLPFIKDLNGDGNTDMFGVSVNYPSGFLQIFRYQYDGKFFEEKRHIVLDITAPNWFEFEAEDVDLDNDIDIALRVDGEISYYLNDGQANFTKKTILTQLPESYFMRIADLDQDSMPEISRLLYKPNKIEVYNPHKNTQFTVATGEIDSPFALHAADFDGDQKIDLSATSIDDGKITWFKNLGNGKFSTSKVISDKIRNAYSLCSMDVDKDTDQDLLATSERDHKILWFRNDGAGNFSDALIISDSTMSAPTGVLAADIDQDGYQDAVACSSAGGLIAWYKNDQGRGFLKKINLIAKFYYGAPNIFAADFDKDGDIDIVSGAYFDDKMSWFKNNGDGTFSDEIIISRATDAINSVFGADLDQDGNIDLISTSSVDGKLAWYKNNGVGGFSTQIIIANRIEYINSPVTGDVDGDGDPDIVCLESIKSSILWFENDGKGNFAEKRIISANLWQPNALILADLDNDQDLDVASASQYDDKIAWYENLLNYPIISGVAFWDENENKKFDLNEETLASVPIVLNPDVTISFTNTEGKYQFYVPNGVYQISAQSDSCWELTTDSLVYTLDLSGNRVAKRNFGFSPTSSEQKVKTQIVSAPTRCGFEVPFTVSVINEACVTASGKFGLVLDPLVNLLNASIAPEQIRGDTLLWSYEKLIAAESKAVYLLLEIAGPEYIGDTIHLKGLTYLAAAGTALKLSSVHSFKSEIRCAYDPNDKLVSPSRLSEFPQNYTLFSEEMEFTVRFQNTGNDTAFTVAIRDTLHRDLDWSTFRPIRASHTFDTQLKKDGAVEFLFKNILLPPSITDEPNSHGFVQYKVRAKARLTEQSKITNTAFIYFDFNPPIQTNTTDNVMVSSFPRSTGTTGIGQSFTFKVYPNPFDHTLVLENVGTNDTGTLDFRLVNAQGQLIYSNRFSGKHQVYQLNELTKGIYFYLLKNDRGQLMTSGKLLKF